MTDNNINIPEATPVTMTQLQDLLNTSSEQLNQQTADLIAASSASGGTNNGNSNSRDSHTLELKELHKKILALEAKQAIAKARQEIEEFEKFLNEKKQDEEQIDLDKVNFENEQANFLPPKSKLM